MYCIYFRVYIHTYVCVCVLSENEVCIVTGPCSLCSCTFILEKSLEVKLIDGAVNSIKLQLMLDLLNVSSRQEREPADLG